MSNSPIHKQCRICYESDDENDLFSPCKCTGTSKYVHRKCLNEWFEKSNHENSLHKCMECNYEYKKNIKCNRCYKISNLILQYFCVSLIVIIGFSCLFGYLIYCINERTHSSKDITDDDINTTNNNNLFTTKTNDYINYFFYGVCTSVIIFFIIIIITHFYFKHQNYNDEYDKVIYKLLKYHITTFFCVIASYICSFLIISSGLLILFINHSSFTYIQYINLYIKRRYTEIIDFNYTRL